jgi:tRNA nucleotidyltransferase (CCA-adding enzyme)
MVAEKVSRAEEFTQEGGFCPMEATSFAEGASSTSAKITHSDISTFAANSVNLKREDAKIYREQVNRLRDKLDRFVDENPNYGLVKMLLSGSLAKGTALKTINDIDVALYVKAAEAPQSEVDLLNWIAERLRKAYPQMAPDQIRPATHCVRISFKGTGLDVDVSPVHYAGDPQWRGHLYNRETGKPLLTSIPMHIEFIRKRKNSQPEDFAQVVRLVKWWVKQRKRNDESFRLKSFISEMLVSRLADDRVNMADYPAALEAFFRYIVKTQLKTRIAFPDHYPTSKLPAATGKPIEIFDPVNEVNNVSSDYSLQDRQRIIDAAEESLERLAEARFATTRGRAVECWQDILGPSFRG